MVICDCEEKLLQEATAICRGRVYLIANDKRSSTIAGRLCDMLRQLKSAQSNFKRPATNK